MSDVREMEAGRERGILMSGPMVRATLAGHETVTRRVVKPQPDPRDAPDPEYNPDGSLAHAFGDWWTTSRLIDGSVPRDWAEGDEPGGEFHHRWWRAPYRPGDRLYVRESFVDGGPFVGVLYRADYAEGVPAGIKGGWKPSIHMPKGYARIWLRVEDVRVEQVRDIWVWAYTYRLES